MINRYKYHDINFYFNMLYTNYNILNYNKNIKSEWFYLGKEFQNQIKINNIKNTFEINFDILLNIYEKNDFINIFKENKGKYGKFWLELPLFSYVLARDASIGSNYIVVENTNNYLTTSNFKRHIAISKTPKYERSIENPNTNNRILNGLTLAKITSVQNLENGTEKINLDKILEFDLLKGTECISDLLLVRFDFDNMVINRVNTDLYKITLTFKELQQETI